MSVRRGEGYGRRREGEEGVGGLRKEEGGEEEGGG